MLLNDIINQKDLTDIYRTFFQNAKRYTFFSAAHGVLYKTNHIVGHQPSLNKYRRNVITFCILADYDGIKLDVHSNQNRRKYKNSSKPSTTQLNDNCVNEEFRIKNIKSIELKANKSVTCKNLWDTTEAVLREKFIMLSACIR